MIMQKELFQAVFDNVYNGVYVVDRNGVTVAVNKTFEEMSGITEKELLGKKLYDLVHIYKYFSGSASLLVLESGKPATVTYSTKTNKKLLVKGRPVKDSAGEIDFIINTIWDLTDIRYTRDIDSDTARDRMLSEADIVAFSEKMRDVIDLAMNVAHTDSSVLLLGEAGVGKALVAQLLHRGSNRSDVPFVQVNCATLPENLLEIELFGSDSAEGKAKPGAFEAANGGTLFIDEISELPVPLQAKLHAVLQDKCVTRVGSKTSIPVDVRVVAASDHDILSLVEERVFREDLYYRLNVVPIEIPPLRERREDIRPLAQYFSNKFNMKYRTYKTIADDALRLMEIHEWRGNVSELENMVERLIVTSKTEVITGGAILDMNRGEGVQKPLKLKKALGEYEKELLVRARKQCRTTRDMAQMLGISQPSVVRKMQRYGIK